MHWSGAPVGDDPTDVFVISVGLVALGRFLASGSVDALALLRRRAADDEWRIREAVAIGLQRLGDDRPGRLADIARGWSSGGDPLVARAAVAAVAEPRLLRTSPAVDAALDVMDSSTRLVIESADRRAEPVRILRQALGYAWSVVVAADPGRGWPRFVAWSTSHAGRLRRQLDRAREPQEEPPRPPGPDPALGRARAQPAAAQSPAAMTRTASGPSAASWRRRAVATVSCQPGGRSPGARSLSGASTNSR